jgi:hypothetical protein
MVNISPSSLISCRTLQGTDSPVDGGLRHAHRKTCAFASSKLDMKLQTCYESRRARHEFFFSRLFGIHSSGKREAEIGMSG